MPPKVKFGKESIVNAAFEIVRKHGWNALSARSIAEELKSSTRPIYSQLTSMKKLEEEVVRKAMTLLEEYIGTTRTGDPWLDHGYGYVLFAKKEKRLFKALLDDKHNHLYKEISSEIFDNAGEELSDYPLFEGIPKELQRRLRATRWIFVHGMASLIAQSYEFDDFNTEEEYAELIRIVNTLLYKGQNAVLSESD